MKKLISAIFALALAAQLGHAQTLGPTAGGGGSSSLTVGTTPITGGADTQVLFNDVGTVGSDAGLTFAKTTDRLTNLGGLTITQGQVNTNVLLSTGYSLTGSDASSLIDLAGTWNTSGTPSAIKVNITNTASNAASLLLDLQRNGASVFAVRAAAGAFNAPSLYLSGDTLTGWYRNAADQWTWVAGNSDRLSLIGSSIRMASDMPFGWSSGGSTTAADLILWRDAANTLAQRNGTAGQILRVYNTWTDASNYERAFFGWVANVLYIGGSHAGTGSARTTELTSTGALNLASAAAARWQVNTSGHLLALADNTYDIGASGASRPRTGYFGTSVITPFLTLSPPVNTSALTSTGYSLTGSNASSMIDLAGALNTSGTPSVIKVNIAYTAANSASAFLDLQDSGNNIFKVGRALKFNYGVFVGGTYEADTFLEINSGGTLYSSRPGGLLRYQLLANGNLRFPSDGYYAFNSTNDLAGGALDTYISRSAAGIIRIGTGATDALGSLALVNAVHSGYAMFGSATALTLTAGAIGMAKITASASAPGAAGAKLELVCGTNAGTAKLIIAAGTSGTAVTVVDNVGAGVTGC